jgi:hypothetical protein
MDNSFGMRCQNKVIFQMSEIVAAWGKSKCGAMRWLVPLVAPLLILPKRWLVLSFVCLFNVCTVVHRVTANVLRLGVVADF